RPKAAKLQETRLLGGEGLSITTKVSTSRTLVLDVGAAKKPAHPHEVPALVHVLLKLILEIIIGSKELVGFGPLKHMFLGIGERYKLASRLAQDLVSQEGDCVVFVSERDGSPHGVIGLTPSSLVSKDNA